MLLRDGETTVIWYCSTTWVGIFSFGKNLSVNHSSKRLTLLLTLTNRVFSRPNNGQLSINTVNTLVFPSWAQIRCYGRKFCQR